jgi:hypothetical protein
MPTTGFKTFQLPEIQLQQLASLASEPLPPVSGAAAPLLPFRAGKYTRRIDPWDVMAHYNIHRDKYERKMPPVKPVRCVQCAEDFPEYYTSWNSSGNKAYRNHYGVNVHDLLSIVESVKLLPAR